NARNVSIRGTGNLYRHRDTRGLRARTNALRDASSSCRCGAATPSKQSLEFLVNAGSQLSMDGIGSRPECLKLFSLIATALSIKNPERVNTSPHGTTFTFCLGSQKRSHS